MKNSFKMNALVAIVGAILLFLVSSYTWPPLHIDPFADIFDKAMGHIFPASLPLFYMMFFLLSYSIFVIPMFFCLLSLFSRKKNYSYFFIALISIFMIMDFTWIIHYWSYGLEYQGKCYTIIVTIANSIFFFVLYSLLFIFKKTKKNQWIHSANFLLCLMLIFLMFPWLGESI